MERGEFIELRDRFVARFPARGGESEIVIRAWKDRWKVEFLETDFAMRFRVWKGVDLWAGMWLFKKGPSARRVWWGAGIEYVGSPPSPEEIAEVIDGVC